MPEHITAADLNADGITLEPLRLDHADEMVDVLADPVIYEFIGGEPPTLEALRTRYRAQVLGASPDGDQTWLNWVIRMNDTADAAGYVQATIESTAPGRGDDAPVADVAWVVAPRFQGRGIATAAARAMCRHLRDAGINSFSAHVHPEHAASQAVARSIGLEPTGDMVDGEVRWIG